MLVPAYKTSDGLLFESEKEAGAHQSDLLGESLDTLLPDTGGNITRADRHRLLMALFEDPELCTKVAGVHAILQHMASEDCPV